MFSDCICFTSLGPSINVAFYIGKPGTLLFYESWPRYKSTRDRWDVLEECLSCKICTGSYRRLVSELEICVQKRRFWTVSKITFARKSTVWTILPCWTECMVVWWDLEPWQTPLNQHCVDPTKYVYYLSMWMILYIYALTVFCRYFTLSRVLFVRSNWFNVQCSMTPSNIRLNRINFVQFCSLTTHVILDVCWYCRRVDTNS